MLTYLPQLNRTVRLGLKAIPPTKPVLTLANFLPSSLPPAPAAVDNYSGVDFPMYANDRVGDCAIASPAHLIGGWTQKAGGKPLLFTDSQIIAEYSAVSGYDPRTGANDNGCTLEDVQERWLRTGLFGRKVVAYAGVNAADHSTVRQGAFIFGGATIGLNMPAAWQNATGPGGVWDAGNGFNYRPGTWGGHAVPILGYDDRYYYVVTWGHVQKLTPAALQTYCLGVFVNLSEDWVAANKKSPSGFDVAALIAAFDVLNGAAPAPTWPTPYSPPSPPAPPGPTPPVGGFTGTANYVGGTLTGFTATAQVGTWFDDLTGWSQSILHTARDLAAKYGASAQAVLDAAVAFADAPGFDTASAVWEALKKFSPAVSAAHPAVRMKADGHVISSLLQWAMEIAKIIAMFK